VLLKIEGGEYSPEVFNKMGILGYLVVKSGKK
jgi:hypothetical protein